MNSRVRTTLLAFSICLTVFGLAAPSALADRFCVGTSTCDAPPANVFPMTRDGLADALLAAQNTAESSVVEIGSGTLTIDSPVAVAASETNQVSIEGVGSDPRALLHFTHPSGDGLTFNGTGLTSGGIANLDVKLDPAVAARKAFAMTGGRVDSVHFEITAANFFGASGVSLTTGAECVSCTFDLAGSGAGGASATGTASISRSTFTHVGVESDETRGIASLVGSSLNVSTSKFIGLSTAVSVSFGTASIVDSVIDLGSRSSTRGVDIDASSNSTGTRAGTLDGVTVVGTGDSQIGVRTAAETTNGAGETATGNVKNSIFLLAGGGSTDLWCVEGANGTSTMNVGWSLINSSSPALTGACNDSQTNNVQSDTVQLANLFVDHASGDYRLKPGAPVIDDGDQNTSLTGRATDAFGNPRLFGTKIDIGGSEYQNYAPENPRIVAPPKTALVGEAVSFTGSASDANGDTLTYSWDYGDSVVAATNEHTITHEFGLAGTFTVQLTVSDGSKQSETVETQITITAPPIDHGTTVVDDPLTNFRFTKPKCKFKSNKKAKNAFTLSTAKPKGCSLQGASTRATSYTFRLEHLNAGYVVGSSCKAKQGKSGKTNPGKIARCNLPLKGSQAIDFPASTAFLSFGGRWNKKLLPPGNYRVTVINAGGMANRTSVVVTVYKAKQGSRGKTK